MIKRVKNKLPYPKDVKKEAIPDTVSSYLILRLLCTYFDHLTGVKISAEIPEMSSYLDEYLITGKDFPFYSSEPDRIKEQLYTKVLEKTSFVATTIKLCKRKKINKNIEQTRAYFEKVVKKDLTESQKMLYRRLPSPVLNGIAANADLAVYLSSNSLSGYFQFAERNEQLILQSFHDGDILLRSMIKSLKLWSGNSYLAEEKQIMDLIGFSITGGNLGRIYGKPRPNFFALLCFIDELLAFADNSFHFIKEEVN